MSHRPETCPGCTNDLCSDDLGDYCTTCDVDTSSLPACPCRTRCVWDEDGAYCPDCPPEGEAVA